MISYKRFSEQMQSDERGTYETYGIIAESADEVVRTIHDLSPDGDKVQALVEIFNEGRLSVDHLDIAVENFLYDFEV